MEVDEPGTSKSAPSLGGIEKKEDFTEAAASLVAEAGVMASAGELDKAIEQLFALEKKCRLANDISSLKAVVLGMVNVCKAAPTNWPKLNFTITTIAKRHQQSRHAVSAVLEQCMGWVDEAPDEAAKVALITALRDVTDGKIYAEAERAKLTRSLAVIKEAQGDVAGACEVMLDVYVETFGALTKREKIDFILDQIRLCILKEDWVRVTIVAKKVQTKFLEEEDMQDLKLRYYGLLGDFYLREKDAFSLAKAYHAMASTPCKAEDDGPGGWRPLLASAVLFLCLASRTPEQKQMLHAVAKDERLGPKLPAWEATIKLFTTDEIIAFPLASQAEVEAQLKAVIGEYKLPEAEALFGHWRLLTHERTTQHNLRVASGYYKRIRVARLAELLGLSQGEAEKHLSALVSEGQVFAKIDRPAGVVTFSPKVSAEETLSAWSSDLGNLLTLVERTCHLINKEHMIHKVV